jgi:transposase-like protein
LTPKKDFEQDVMGDVEAPVREGVKAAVLEELLEPEMIEHLEAGDQEYKPARRGERNGHYASNLLIPAGKIERLAVPRDREGAFVTVAFERYKRATGSLEDTVLEMSLSGVSTGKIASITDVLNKVRIGKDTVSRVSSRLEEFSFSPRATYSETRFFALSSAWPSVAGATLPPRTASASRGRVSPEGEKEVYLCRGVS